jgi:DNA-binding IclR family transcriptional regulator
MEALQHDLQKVRERGYALNLGEHLTEVYAIGVPVQGEDRRPVAAITAAGPVTRWNRRALRALAPTLTRTAAEITQDLVGPAAPAEPSVPAADAYVRA